MWLLLKAKLYFASGDMCGRFLVDTARRAYLLSEAWEMQ